MNGTPTVGTPANGLGIQHIVQSSPTDANWLDYTMIVDVAAETMAGEFVTSNGVAAGEPMPLAAAGDEDTGTVYLVIERVDAIPQDIDTAIPALAHVRVMRQTGGMFEVACWRYDASTSLLKGQKMCLEATGQLMIQAYVQSTEATDFHPFLVELSRDSADVADLDPVIYIWF